MAVVPTPALPQGTIGNTVSLTSAITNPASPTTITGLVQLCQASASGAIITRCTMIPSATTTVVNVAGLYTSTDAGTNKRKIQEIQMATDTGSTTDMLNRYRFDATSDDPIILGPNEILYAGIQQLNPATTGWLCRVEGRQME